MCCVAGAERGVQRPRLWRGDDCGEGVQELLTRGAVLPRAGLFVLREPGPTSFVLRGEASAREFRVSIGETHSCSCRAGGGSELCEHVIFVLVRVFRMPVENPLVWQLSLTEREIGELMRGRVRLHTRAPSRDGGSGGGGPRAEEAPRASRKEVVDGDVCPICYDELGDGATLTFCREGCGSNVHTKCMKLWADNRIKAGEDVTCPMCRGAWGVPDWLHSAASRQLRSQRFDSLAGEGACLCRGQHFAAAFVSWAARGLSAPEVC